MYQKKVIENQEGELKRMYLGPPWSECLYHCMQTLYSLTSPIRRSPLITKWSNKRTGILPSTCCMADWKVVVPHAAVLCKSLGMVIKYLAVTNTLPIAFHGHRI